MRYANILIVLISLVLLTGCGPPKAGVSGTVTVDGKPLPDYIVSFEPVSLENSINLVAVGTTDAQGQYTLADLKTKEPVCPVGKCRVRIIWNNPKKPAPGSEEVIPYKPPIELPESTMDGSMIFEVPSAGTDKANFDLKSIPR